MFFSCVIVGLNGYNIDPAALAMDYRSVGFRECAAEVARYLVTVEGMDIQDPLRLRLMSHLQCYSAQREAAAKASLQTTLQTNSWNNMSSHHGLQSQYSSGSMSSMAPAHPMISQHPHAQPEQLPLPSHPSGLSSVSCTDSRLGQCDSSLTSMATMRLPSTGSVAPQVHSVVSSTAGSQMSTPMLHSQFPSMHSQFPVSLSVNSLPMLSPSGTHSYSPSTSVKPYRPWGAELAY